MNIQMYACATTGSVQCDAWWVVEKVCIDVCFKAIVMPELACIRAFSLL
jgi:hypothetical protein